MSKVSKVPGKIFTNCPNSYMRPIKIGNVKSKFDLLEYFKNEIVFMNENSQSPFGKL